MKLKLPELKTDNEAENFIDTSDLTEYDLSALVPMQFEFQRNEQLQKGYFLGNK